MRILFVCSFALIASSLISLLIQIISIDSGTNISEKEIFPFKEIEVKLYIA